MAEDQEKAQELSNDEAQELERLLDDDGGEVANAAGLKGKLQKILVNKKVLMIILVILVLIIGIGFFFLRADEEMEVTPIDEQAVEEEVDEKDEVQVEKVNIYKLDPFFLPLLDDGKETGKFLTVSANLLLSNSVLNGDLNKVLPSLRKSIYNILKRKRPSDFTRRRTRTEERIKKEILTASNALLLSGTGTITDVFFSSFMIK